MHLKVISFQKELQKHKNKKTKIWFENYLKGVIEYYGVKTPNVRQILKKWYQKEQIADFSLKE